MTSNIRQLGFIFAVAAAPLAAIQMPDSFPTIPTPNGLVADAFSAMPLTAASMEGLTDSLLRTPQRSAATTLSANSVVAAAFDLVSSNAPETTGSLAPERAQANPSVNSSVDAPSPEQMPIPERVRTANASANMVDPDEADAKDYIFSESQQLKLASATPGNAAPGTPAQEVDRAAAAVGLDARFMRTVAKIESDFNPKQRTGSYVGLFQLSKDEFKRYGSGNILNARDNATAAARKFVAQAVLFEEATQRKLTFTDLYLIHQQGWEGAAEHLSHPEQLAWKSMCATQEGMSKGERWCKRAIWGNTLPDVKREVKSVDHLTSRRFVAMWRDRIQTFYARYLSPTMRSREL